MKNLFFSFFVVVLMIGCSTNPVVNTVDTVRKVQVEPEFFYTVKDTVINGHNTWNRAKLFYKDGFQWKHIVEENEFLQEPGRIWQDTTSGIWYCLILPGEVLNIGKVQVNPMFQDSVISPVPNPNDLVEQSFPWWAFFPWGWFIAAICFLAIATKLLTMVNWRKVNEKLKGKFSNSPTTEGKPFVDGGVNAENARNHFVTLAQRNNPGADIQITNRRQGYLSTVGGAPATVEFGDGTKQKLSFRNEPAFAAMVSINRKPAKEEYFFQGCGNPVYTRRSMNAGKNLIFSIEPINFGDEVVNSAGGNIIRETAEVVKEEKPVVEKRVDQSNEVMIINDHAIVAAEFLQTQTAHKVVMEYINGGVTIRSIFETKNPAKEEAKKEKENEQVK